MTQKIKTYSELVKYKTFDERYSYLKLSGAVGETTFGFNRYLNQMFYNSPEWRRVRDLVIFRDNGCDLGIEDREIYGQALIHHINPITADDLIKRTDLVLNPEYLITTTLSTHNAIHYGDESLLFLNLNERTKNDTCPWRKD